MLLVFQTAAGIVLAAVVLFLVWAYVSAWAERKARHEAIDRAWDDDEVVEPSELPPHAVYSRVIVGDITRTADFAESVAIMEYEAWCRPRTGTPLGRHIVPDVGHVLFTRTLPRQTPTAPVPEYARLQHPRED